LVAGLAAGAGLGFASGAGADFAGSAGTVGFTGATEVAPGASVPAFAAEAVALAAVASSGVTIDPVAIAGL
jgi:hypothetical protein